MKTLLEWSAYENERSTHYAINNSKKWMGHDPVRIIDYEEKQ